MNKLAIFGLVVVALVALVLLFTILADDFRIILIPDTREDLSHIEACTLINGDWNFANNSCDDIDKESCSWLRGSYYNNNCLLD